MPLGKTLNQEEIGKVKAFKEIGLSNREIARRLGRSPRVINNFFKDPENYGKGYKGGVKTATTSRERRRILNEASNSSMTARQIKEVAGTSASVRTVQRIIKEAPHLQRQKLRKKPALKQFHKDQRLQFARVHMDWTDQWHQVIFSDEKRFCLDGPDGFSYYFHDLRKEQRFLAKRHSRFGGIMVWGAISYNGPIDLVILEGRQTSEDYRNLLCRVRERINEVMGSNTWIFQHDHAGIHTASIVNQWFVEVLNWPSLSPDLNIIENLWGWLTRTVYENSRQFENMSQLIEVIKDTWNRIPLNIIHSLYESMPSRVYEVIRNNGNNTKY